MRSSGGSSSSSRSRRVVSGIITPDHVPSVCFVNPTEHKGHEKFFLDIKAGEFLLLTGPRASGKATRACWFMQQLFDEKYLSFYKQQVHTLFKEFEEMENIQIDDEIVDDTYIKTSGTKRNPPKIWHVASFQSLKIGNVILDYQTFIRMKDALLKESARRAMKFFRTYFLANSDPIVVNNTDLAQFLTAEGALLTNKEAGSFKISSPL
ncbi:5882_t:CDS:2, partial [Funneliformis mosseae]